MGIVTGLEAAGRLPPPGPSRRREQQIDENSQKNVRLWCCPPAAP